MAMENFAENIRDKSPPVTDPEALAAALSNVGTMSPRLRKLYDDAAALLRTQAAECKKLRAALTLAANRMDVLALDLEYGTTRRNIADDWAKETRAALGPNDEAKRLP